MCVSQRFKLCVCVCMHACMRACVWWRCQCIPQLCTSAALLHELRVCRVSLIIAPNPVYSNNPCSGNLHLLSSSTHKPVEAHSNSSVNTH